MNVTDLRAIGEKEAKWVKEFPTMAGTRERAVACIPDLLDYIARVELQLVAAQDALCDVVAKCRNGETLSNIEEGCLKAIEVYHKHSAAAWKRGA